MLATVGLADVLREALGTKGIDLAFVYGSIAADTPTAGSDVDLLIVGNVGLREALLRLREAHDALGREINPNVWTRTEFDRRMAERDVFLMQILSGPGVPVIGDIPETRGLTRQPARQSGVAPLMTTLAPLAARRAILEFIEVGTIRSRSQPGRGAA